MREEDREREAVKARGREGEGTKRGMMKGEERGWRGGRWVRMKENYKLEIKNRASTTNSTEQRCFNCFRLTEVDNKTDKTKRRTTNTATTIATIVNPGSLSKPVFNCLRCLRESRPEPCED